MTNRGTDETGNEASACGLSVVSVSRQSKGVQPPRSLIHVKNFLGWHGQWRWLARTVHFMGWKLTGNLPKITRYEFGNPTRYEFGN
jgi:hypothetical protein